jgi:hypothetical protein
MKGQTIYFIKYSNISRPIEINTCCFIEQLAATLPVFQPLNAAPTHGVVTLKFKTLFKVKLSNQMVQLLRRKISLNYAEASHFN